MTAPLTADLFARAIIAACVSYGDHPIAAIQAAPGSNYRRAMAPALYGLHEATGISRLRLCRIAGVSSEGSRSARQRGGDSFRKAQEAAREAVAYHVRGQELVAARVAALEPAPKPAAVAAPQHRPPVFFARDPALTQGVKNADRPVTDLVLEALARGPLNTMSIAFQIDRKELSVSSALSQLAHEGLVSSSPVENSPRAVVWGLAERVAA